MAHRNARLTVHGRLLLVQRVQTGRPVAHVAAEMGVSRSTAHKWIARWRAEGVAGLADRSSRPHTITHRAPAAVEDDVCRLRRDRKLRPVRIGAILGRAPSTVHRVLTCATNRPIGLPQLVRVAYPAGASRNASKRPRTRSAWTTTRSASTPPAAGVEMLAETDDGVGPAARVGEEGQGDAEGRQRSPAARAHAGGSARRIYAAATRVSTRDGGPSGAARNFSAPRPLV